MKIYKALIMAIILVCGVLYLRHYEQNEVEVDGKQGKTIKLFIPDQAQFIGLQRTDSYLSAVKDTANGGSWKLVDPEGAPADNAQLAKLLQTLAEINTHAVIKPDEQNQDKASYGLNPAELVVTVNDGNKDHKFSFGALNFISGRRYFQVEADNNIYLIDSLVFRSVDLVEGQFRQSRPYQFKVTDVEEIIATQFNKNPIQLVKQQDNSWKAFGDGDNVDADSEMITNALDQMASFQVAKFIDLEVKASLFNLDPADLKVEIRFKDKKKKPLIVLFGEAKKIKGVDQLSSNSGILLDWEDTEIQSFTKSADAPWIYKMNSPIYRDFYRSLLEFKKKEIFTDLSLDRLQNLHIKSTKNGEVVISKNEQSNSWNLVIDAAGNKTTAAVEKLSAYVESLLATTVLSFQPQAVSADVFGVGVLEIRFQVKGDNIREYSLAVGGRINNASEKEAEDAPRYVKIKEPNGSEFYGVVSAGILADLDEPRSFFEGIK